MEVNIQYRHRSNRNAAPIASCKILESQIAGNCIRQNVGIILSEFRTKEIEIRLVKN